MTDQEEGRSLAESRPAESCAHGGEQPRDSAADAKRLANLRARAALQGIELHTIDADHGRPVHIVTKWALTHCLTSLDELAAWMRLVDGRQE
jgi:hypothetical protein